MKLSPLLFLVPVISLFSACTTTGNNVPNVSELLRDTTGQNGRACIRTSDIQGYGIQEDGVVNVDSTKGYYIATLRPGCMDLYTSMGTIFSGDFNEICGGRIDKVITQSGECSINQIFEFKNRDEAMAGYERVVEKRNEIRASQ